MCKRSRNSGSRVKRHPERSEGSLYFFAAKCAVERGEAICLWSCAEHGHTGILRVAQDDERVGGKL